jgi:hypothetical protein
MKINWILFVVLISATTACGKKTFEASNPSTQDDHFGDDDDIIDPIDPTGEECPRYDLVVDSTDENSARRNYRFIYNSEMKKTATQGEIDVTFHKNSPSVRYTLCSGGYTNTSIATGLKPLNATEELTKQLVRHVGQVCAMVMPLQQTTISVVDSANGKVLFNEQKFRQDMGCEFGYTAAGQSLRAQLIQFSHGVVDAKASSCNR